MSGCKHLTKPVMNLLSSSFFIIPFIQNTQGPQKQKNHKPQKTRREPGLTVQSIKPKVHYHHIVILLQLCHHQKVSNKQKVHYHYIVILLHLCLHQKVPKAVLGNDAHRAAVTYAPQ